jgi:hypothetical protein
MTTNIIVEPISLHDVQTFDRIRYNSNNHWVNNTRPDDYQVVLDRYRTKEWIDYFHRSYSVFNINTKHCSWIRKAAATGHITGKFPRGFEDEMDLLVAEYTVINTKFFTLPDRHYFVRTETVSLKNGIHGAGPYRSVRQIVESICTCTDGHSPMEDFRDLSGIKIYLMEWQSQLDQEFRVFVYHNEITAISQQHLYMVNETLNNNLRAKEQIYQWIDVIRRYFNEHLRERLRHLDSYCMDLAIRKDGTPYFIEANCFGKEYAAGSALFHWIRDMAILTPPNRIGESIVFRYVAQ